MFTRIIAALTVTLAAAAGTSASAQSLDAHKVYEQKCARCHEAHAGDFVGKHLTRADGALIGRKTRQGLQAFLAGGHGRLGAAEVDAVVDLLTFISRQGQLYKRKCVICHDRAVVLARRKLILRDGRLMGRYTGADIAAFLKNHGRLNADEVAQMVDVLTYHLSNGGE